MKKLKKHYLSFFPTISYFSETLSEANKLSSVLLNLINFEKGHFFSLLPQTVNEEALYEFRSGAISTNTYQETAKFVLDTIKSNDHLLFFIDDVIRSPFDKNIPNFGVSDFFYKEEVYYLINKQSTTKEKILNCLQKTNAIWHSLFLLTEEVFDLDLILSKKLDEEKIKNICLRSVLIGVGAYDGEGYIFWEKTEKTSLRPPRVKKTRRIVTRRSLVRKRSKKLVHPR